MFLLPARVKKIRLKMKALECSQHYTSIFRRSRADNSRVRDGIWPKFELIQALMHALVTCKLEDDSIKNEGARVVTTFPHFKSMGIFPQSLVRSGRISKSMSSLRVRIKKILSKKMKALEWSQNFPH